MSSLPLSTAPVRKPSRWISIERWTGGGSGQDSEWTIHSKERGVDIVVVTHRIPRYAACSTDELKGNWKDHEPLMRTTTMTFEDRCGDLVVEVAEEVGLEAWIRDKRWCGQTSFVFQGHCKDDRETQG